MYRHFGTSWGERALFGNVRPCLAESLDKEVTGSLVAGRLGLAALPQLQASEDSIASIRLKNDETQSLCRFTSEPEKSR